MMTVLEQCQNVNLMVKIYRTCSLFTSCRFVAEVRVAVVLSRLMPLPLAKIFGDDIKMTSV